MRPEEFRAAVAAKYCLNQVVMTPGCFPRSWCIQGISKEMHRGNIHREALREVEYIFPHWPESVLTEQSLDEMILEDVVCATDGIGDFAYRRVTLPRWETVA
jgi:hypothetical protein